MRNNFKPEKAADWREVLMGVSGSKSQVGKVNQMNVGLFSSFIIKRYLSSYLTFITSALSLLKFCLHIVQVTVTHNISYRVSRLQKAK